MPDPTNLPRVYQDKEIGHILKRATELQHAEPSAPASGGMTLQELEEIALEAGIDPRYLRRAATELESGAKDDSIWVAVLGDQLTLVREIRVPGELKGEGFERVVEVVQRVSREHGQPSLLGRSLTWRAETPNKSRTVQLTVTSRDGHTDIRLEENLHQFAGGLFGGSVAGVGAGVGLGLGIPLGMNVIGSALFATLFPVGVIGLTFMASREIYRAVIRHRRRAMGELFEHVLAEINTCVEKLSVPGSDTPPALPPG